MTNETKHTTTGTNTTRHTASVVNIPIDKALGDYTFTDIGATTISTVASDTFQSIFTPVTNQTKHTV